MTFNPFEDRFQDLSDLATSGASNLQDVLKWLERDECPLGEAARRTYAQAVRKAARLIGRTPDRIPACSTQFQSMFPNKEYVRSWGKTFCAAKRWKRNVSAAINGATGTIAAQKERRSRRDDWAALLAVLGAIAEKNLPSLFELHPKQLICVQSCADIARKLEVRLTDIDPDVAFCLYRAAPTRAAKDAVVEALDLIDQSRFITDRRIQSILPVQPVGFVRPERAEKVTIPASVMQELDDWVDLASRGRWSITDNAYTGGVSPTPYLNAAKKIITTAERAGALKLAELNTIAAAFDERVLVTVVRMLRNLHKNDGVGAITPRTARGYFECLTPLLERNGADTSSVRMILDTDRWLKTGRRSRTEMSPHVRSFCRSVVTNMNARIQFLSLHIQLRKNAILHLKAAQMTTGREAERYLEKARRFGTCAAFAALETDAIPARVSSVLRSTFRGSAAWLCLGYRKVDDGRLMIPAAHVKNRKPLFATISATSRLRGLETLRWYEEVIRPLFSNHQNDDHFFPAIKKQGWPLPYATFKSWWSDCAAECGFPGLNPHMFRHGQASILVAENPGNWSLVAARLGDTEAICKAVYAWIDHEKLVLAGQLELTKEFPNAA